MVNGTLRHATTSRLLSVKFKSVSVSIYYNEGMPSNTVGHDDCRSLFTGDLSGNRDSKTCFNIQAFICKVQVGK